VAYPVKARSVEWSPSPQRLRELTERMPNSRITEFGSVAVRTRVDSRSPASTYIVTDEPGPLTRQPDPVPGGPDAADQHPDTADHHPDSFAHQTISRVEYERIAAAQDAYIADRDMLVVDGYLGSDPEFRTRSRLVVEAANANVAAMQQQLWYPMDPHDTSDPVTTVIATPTLTAPGYPDDRIIAVDLTNRVTRVLNTDSFGEAKWAALRMWNDVVFERGGLALHAGCKAVPVAGRHKTVLIVGLSGTGKTTTTFTRQLGSRPVQDDFVALMPGGKVYATENGCFAKTFGLDPRFESAIFHATTQPDAYLENVSLDEAGSVDFFDTASTRNGRTTWPFDQVDAYDPAELAPAEYVLILNRDESILPAVAQLDRAQAAAYFMLGETGDTRAAGREGRDARLRIPGTNPFFPRSHADVGNRVLDLMDSHPMKVYVLNTGRVGGPDGDDRSKKITIPVTSAVVAAIAQESIEWTVDPDFGYEVAKGVPGVDDPELLQPVWLYQRQGRLEEYRERVARLQQERRDYLAELPGLDEAILKAIG
jgi:phosphoenolpyruvate carboxykinase (ATP)